MGCLALGYTPEHSKIGLKVVGATGFEPATPCAQGRCATRLRYAPTLKILDSTAVFCSSLVRVRASLSWRKLSQNCPRTQFTVPELPIHHPTCPRTPADSLAARLSFCSASRFICNFICEYFLKTFASPCRSSCVTTRRRRRRRSDASRRSSADRRCESTAPSLAEASTATPS